MTQMTQSFQQFQQKLAQKLEVAHKMGLSDAHIDQSVKKIADWMAEEVAPQSPEQAMLKEMWESANNQERQAMASVLHKVVEQHPKH